MVVVPLVFVTLVSGIISMGDPSKLGSLGVRTLALYLVTTLIAISIGLCLAAIMQPGTGVGPLCCRAYVGSRSYPFERAFNEYRPGKSDSRDGGG